MIRTPDQRVRVLVSSTLSELAAQLDGEYTVVSYDRRGYSRSQLADPAAPVTIG